MEKIFLTKDMNHFQDGSFESFNNIEEALKRASELNFRGFIFIGKIECINSITVFYTDADVILKSRTFSCDDFECDLINFIKSHDINSVRKSIVYTIKEEKVFRVDFESTLDPHKMAHL